MRLFALNNDRASTLHAYHTCVSTLQREMGIDPAPATREAYERLLQHVAPAIQPVVHQPLHDAWQHETLGGPHFVLVSGEAGISKSRLAEDFLLWVSQQGAVTAKARSYAAEGQLSLAPVTQWLRSGDHLIT